MEIKKYPRVRVVEKFSDRNGKGINPYPEDTQKCCLLTVVLFYPREMDKRLRTTVEGLDDDLVLENILVDLKKECQCKGKIVQDGKLGRMIQLEGDRASQVEKFLQRQGLTMA